MVLKDIVKKYIISNKKNTLLIIISIIISTALFLVMNIISEDVRNIMIDQSKKELGLKHAAYYNPTDKEINYIENNKSIDKLGKQMLVGFHDMGNSQTLHIVSDDKIAKEISNSYKLNKGEFPTKENEIAIDTWYIKQKKIKNPIGKIIKLDYNKYSENGKKLLYKGEKKFKIVGILNSNPILKSQGTSMGVVSEECAIKNIPLKNKYDQVVFTLKKEKNIQKQVENLVKNGDLNSNKVSLNNQLILAMSDSINLKIPYIIVNLILALATILLIYNIFYILVHARTKEFGILRALGFVPLDVCKIMWLEVLIYSLISIPIGLLLGTSIANLSSKYVIGVIYNITYVNSIKSNSYINTYIISILLSVVTIIISVVNPLKICYKIDPMVSIRRSEEEIKINQKSYISKIMTMLFRDYGNIASKNIQRNKKRTNLAIASMSMVFFLMIIIYTKGTSNFLNNGGLRCWIPGDYLIHNINIDSKNKNEKSYDTDTLKEIENIDGVNKVKAYRDKHFAYRSEEKNINKKSTYWNDKASKDILEMNSEVVNGTKLYRHSFEVLGVEDTEILKNVLIDGKENLSKLEKSPYVYVDKETSDTLNIKKDDSIKLDFDIADSKTGNYKETISREFIVGGIISNLPVTAQEGATFSAVISVNQMNKLTGISSYERFDIWTSKLANNNQVESKLNKILEKSGKGILIPYKNESNDIEKSDNQKIMIMILVVGIVIVLSLFNCCNTIVTSINSRNREFALFRGMGISKSEIKKIIYIESLIYVLLSFTIAIVPSLIVRCIIIKDFSNIHLINLEFIGTLILINIILITIIMITASVTLKKVQSEDFISQIKMLE